MSDVAALAVDAKDAVTGVNVSEVAADAVVANDAEPNNDPVKIPLNDPVNDPLLTCAELVTMFGGKFNAKEAVLANEAVAGINVIDVAAEAVVANEADPNIDPVKIPLNEPVNDPLLTCAELVTMLLGIFRANDAVVANDADVADPLNEPVNPPVDIVDPETIRPFLAINSFAINYTRYKKFRIHEITDTEWCRTI